MASAVLNFNPLAERLCLLKNAVKKGSTSVGFISGKLCQKVCAFWGIGAYTGKWMLAYFST